jgi:predicted dienelactone hydrolase
MKKNLIVALGLIATVCGGGSAIARPASVPGIDAPELAPLGPDAAGVTTRIIAVHDRLDPLASLIAGHEVHADRVLHLRVWYPARAKAGAVPVTYSATLTGEKGLPDTAFTVPGIAYANAVPAGEHFPLIVLSHGYNNDPVMLSWLAENLATKGYVVVAPEHRDPPIWDRVKLPASLLARPLDIVDCISAMRGGMLGKLVDPTRIALVGYSMGGYGVLTVAGARLDPKSPALATMPASLVSAYTGNLAASLIVPGLRAVVAISPAGGAPWNVWGSGLTGITAPLLVIVGSHDRTVGYEQGPSAIFAAATHADRHMLVFVNAGHSIGTNPVPDEMQTSIWNQGWFADPVWRKDRINAISTHFITAFLDSHVKGDTAKGSYFDVPSPASDPGGWTGGDTGSYAAMSKGGTNPTWKGFWRGQQDGLILEHRPAQ